MEVQKVNDLIKVQSKEPGYKLNGWVWTKSSDRVLWSPAVSYCADRGTKLVTLDDAVEFRHDMDGADNSNDYQHTGTLLALVDDGRAGLRAHVYEPSADELKKIAKKVVETPYIDVSLGSELGRQVLKFSKDTGRSFIVPPQNLSLAVAANEAGDSEYSKNDVVRKLMPSNASKNAAVIQGKGYSNGNVLIYPDDSLPNGIVRIRPVGLGDDVCIYYAYNYFFNVGLARGLVHDEQKIFTGNEGRRVAKSRK